ncbi:MAG: MTH1187 family thiamine-binding protein [Chloroflexota bacterium]|nr:MTH1187 family thiamine-binding protein [Chloroflexota bacterium]
MPVCDITVVPEGVEDSYAAVGAVIELIAASGLTYEVGAMSTAVEGDLDALFALARAAHLRAFEQGATTVLTTLRIHDSRTREPSIEDKVGKHRTRSSRQGV